MSNLSFGFRDFFSVIIIILYGISNGHRFIRWFSVIRQADFNMAT